MEACRGGWPGPLPCIPTAAGQHLDLQLGTDLQLQLACRIFLTLLSFSVIPAAATYTKSLYE